MIFLLCISTTANRHIPEPSHCGKTNSTSKDFHVLKTLNPSSVTRLGSSLKEKLFLKNVKWTKQSVQEFNPRIYVIIAVTLHVNGYDVLTV